MQDEWTWLEEFAPGRAGSLQTQLAAFLRDAVRSGRIAPGTVLPPLRKLAARCGVNYFSAQLATGELTAAGYLFKKSGRGGGMRVCDQLPDGSAVAILRFEEPDLGYQNMFANVLTSYLCEELGNRGFRSFILTDRRVAAQRGEITPALTEEIAGNRIHAVLSSSVPGEASGWFNRLPIPHGTLGELLGESESSLEVVRRLLDSGRFRNPWFIGAFNSGNAERWGIADEWLRLGFHIPADRLIAVPHGGRREIEAVRWGFETCRDLLARPDRPDLLIVHTDLTAVGAGQAVLASGLRVPDDLSLCFSRNLGIDYFYPFPVEYFDFDIPRTAVRLVDLVCNPLNNKKER